MLLLVCSRADPTPTACPPPGQALLEELQVLKGERDRLSEEQKAVRQTISSLELENQVLLAKAAQLVGVVLAYILDCTHTHTHTYSNCPPGWRDWRESTQLSGDPTTSCRRRLPHRKR